MDTGHRCARPGMPVRRIRALLAGGYGAPDRTSTHLNASQCTAPHSPRVTKFQARGRAAWRGAARSAGDSKAERSDGPCGSLRPSVCAWGGVLAGWRLHRRMQTLRDLTGRSCLSGAAQQQSEFCGPPRQYPDPGCPAAQRRGRRQQGRLSFGYFSLASPKKSISAAGPRPGLPPSTHHHDHPAAKTTNSIASNAHHTSATSHPPQPNSTRLNHCACTAPAFKCRFTTKPLSTNCASAHACGASRYTCPSATTARAAARKA